MGPQVEMYLYQRETMHANSKFRHSFSNRSYESLECMPPTGQITSLIDWDTQKGVVDRKLESYERVLTFLTWSLVEKNRCLPPHKACSAPRMVKKR